MGVESYPVRWSGQTAIITFPAEVDITSAGQARDRLLSILNGGAATMIADMTATRFCDSAGVNAIVRAYRRASATGTRMQLVIASPAVRRVFAITEIDRLVPVFATVAGALADDSPVPPPGGAGGHAPAGDGEPAGDRAPAAGGDPAGGEPQPAPL